MGVDYRTRNASLLMKIQSAAGVEASPIPGSDAVRVQSGFQIGPSFGGFAPNYVQASVSESEPLVAGGTFAARLQFLLTPSTVAGAAGDPDWATALRACGMSATKTAADVTGTAQAGAAGAITLAAGASAVNDIYKGMVVDITAGTGAGQPPVVTKGYVGSTKVASIYPNWVTPPDVTSVYRIRKNTLLVPITTGMELATIWAYRHNSLAATNSRLYRGMDCMGNPSFNLPVKGPGQLSIDFGGVVPAITADVTKPSSPTYLGLDAQPLQGGRAYLGGAAVKFNALSLNFGNKVAQYDDLNATYGSDSCDIPARTVTGSFNPNMTLLSTRDIIADWVAMQNRELWVSWGIQGKCISLYIPAARYTGAADVDVNGFVAHGVPFRATGLDSEIYLSVC